ncbi:MAG: hypothetical protein R3F49_17115 [Planctomycetota bacterium]
MAQSRKRGAGAGASRPAARSESKKPAGKAAPRAAAASVEIVEEEKGLGIDDGIIILTTIMLFVAFIMVDYHRGTTYGEGMIFKDKYEAPK